MTLPVFGSTVGCAGLDEIASVNVPWLSFCPLTLALALPLSPAATLYFTVCVPGWMAVTFQTKVRVAPGGPLPSAHVFVWAGVPPVGPRSTTHTGRLGSASPGCWLRVLNESTVTARF